MIRLEESIGNPTKLIFDLWGPLMDHEKDLIRSNIEVRYYEKNESVYRIGEKPMSILFVQKGRVKIFRNMDDNRPKIIRIFRDGQFFGYRAYFANEKYSTNCITMEKSIVAALPVYVVQQLVDNNKNVMRYFFHELARGLGLSDDRIASLSQKHLRGRLAETLIFLSKSFGTDKDGWINGKITRRDIANLANMTTSNAIRTMSSFRDEQIIDTDGKKIRLSNPDKLEYISGKE